MWDGDQINGWVGVILPRGGGGVWLGRGVRLPEKGGYSSWKGGLEHLEKGVRVPEKVVSGAGGRRYEYLEY